MFFRSGFELDFRDYQPASELIVPVTQNVRPKFPVIDAHIHLGAKYPGEAFYNRYRIGSMVSLMREAGIYHAVDLELFSEDCFYKAVLHAGKHLDFFSFCMPADLRDFESPNFERRIIHSFDRMASACRTCGIKIWKDIGLQLKRKNGRFASLLDPEFEVIWDYARQNNLPVVIHVADPPAFFKKVNYRNERLEELLRYPMWSYYGKGFPAYSELIRQFDCLVGRNPGVTFIAAHLVSAASNLDLVGRMMEQHPNMYADIAAVLPEIGRQPRCFRRLAKRFPERILFGTDYFGGDSMYYEPYFRFLGTEDEYFAYRSGDDCSQGRWRIYGAGLSERILRKIYAENAKRIYLPDR